MVELTGKCLCEAIEYSYEGKMGDIIHCHCSKCRRWHGSAFRTRAIIEKSGFEWFKGEDMLSYYDSSKNVTKTFCKNCGSNLVSIYKNNSDILGLPLGGIEGKLGNKKSYHIFTDSRAEWHEITDDLEQYDELPCDFNRTYEVK